MIHNCEICGYDCDCDGDEWCLGCSDCFDELIVELEDAGWEDEDEYYE